MVNITSAPYAKNHLLKKKKNVLAFCRLQWWTSGPLKKFDVSGKMLIKLCDEYIEKNEFTSEDCNTLKLALVKECHWILHDCIQPVLFNLPLASLKQSAHVFSCQAFLSEIDSYKTLYRFYINSWKVLVIDKSPRKHAKVAWIVISHQGSYY